MVSIRRACGPLNFDRTTYHYTSLQADQAGPDVVFVRSARRVCGKTIVACMCGFAGFGHGSSLSWLCGDTACTFGRIALCPEAGAQLPPEFRELPRQLVEVVLARNA